MSTKFSSIQDQQIAYMAGVTVEIDTAFSWVDIRDGEHQIFLQGEDAEQFIRGVEWLEAQYCDEADGHALLAAYPYSDVLAGC